MSHEAARKARAHIDALREQVKTLEIEIRIFWGLVRENCTHHDQETKDRYIEWDCDRGVGGSYSEYWDECLTCGKRGPVRRSR